MEVRFKAKIAGKEGKIGIKVKESQKNKPKVGRGEGWKKERNEAKVGENKEEWKRLREERRVEERKGMKARKKGRT